MLLSHRLVRMTLVLAGLAVAGGAAAAAPALQDGARLFRAEAPAQVEAVARRLRERHRVDLRIETFAEFPPEVRKQLDAPRPKKAAAERERLQIIARWAQERARAWGSDGVYVLLVRGTDPRCVVGPETGARAFARGDAERLCLRLRKKPNDAGLTEALGFLERTVEDNLHGGDWLWVLWVMAGCLVTWMGLGLVRSSLDAPEPRRSAVSAEGALNGLLGGTLAAAAGFWLFDSVFGERRPRQQPLPPEDDAGAYPDPDPADGGDAGADSSDVEEPVW